MPAILLLVAGTIGAYAAYRWIRARAHEIASDAPRDDGAVETFVRDPATGVFRPRAPER